MAKTLDRAVEALRRGKRFMIHDAWQIGRPGEKPPSGFLIKHARVVILLVQNLGKNALLLRASALAFASVLAIVPFLAVTFFVIETFSLDKELYAYVARALGVAQAQYAGVPAEALPEPEDLPLPSETASVETPSETGPLSGDEFKREVAEFFLRIYVEGREEAKPGEMSNPIEAIIEFAKRGENPQSIGLAGLIFIVTTVFGLMMNIESAFNQIWGLRDTRTWYRMFSDYVVIVLLLPFFVAAMVSVMAVLHRSSLHLPLSQALVYRAAQYLAVWLSFTMLYVFVPNTVVKLRYALLGGIVGGTLWSMLTWFYIAFQYGLSRYSLLYSTFAQFPVLLMWVYFSWVIVLFGAELTFAYQNEKTFALERFAEKASYAYREALGLRTMVEAARRFAQGLPGLVAEEAAREWNVPLRLVNAVLDEFDHARLLTRSDGPPPRYQPARPLEKITVGHVVTALREAGCDPTALRDDEHFRPLIDRLRLPDEQLMDLPMSALVSPEPPLLPAPDDWDIVTRPGNPDRR